jgi:hypothetical protein
MKNSILQTRTFLDLMNEGFMPALRVRLENLQGPAKWRAEMRAHARSMKVGPASV